MSNDTNKQEHSDHGRSNHAQEDHGHGDHDHPEFLAHHFDDPEQQFDAGKLGIWIFLVTEVLFFSGMFCAYALYRSRNPEVFTFASDYLNTKLGAVNTGVLLFSSLTMAWGVRCAQLRQRAGLVLCLAITLCCAAIFLGVKTVEYTHKWDLGLLPAGMYIPQYLHQLHDHAGISPWLIRLSIIPGLCVIGFAIGFVTSVAKREKRKMEVSGSLLATALAFFLGIFLGFGLQKDGSSAHAQSPAGQHAVTDHGEATQGDAEHSGADEQSTRHESGEAPDHDGETSESDGGNEQANSDKATSAPTGHFVSATAEKTLGSREPGAPLESMVDQPGGAGLFFSIYYCMTGVHALHILGGMLVLTWLLVRASKDVFNEQYFGPVDYVGLYWHLVDLIWIYLFPLLYLIK